jgi:hypothetical protein
MEVFFSFTVTIYVFLMTIGLGKAAECYMSRQLVKANFWLSLCCFCFMGIMALTYIIDLFSD